MERLKAALRCTIATVQQHITSADPNSPAALLAADLAFHSAARGGDASGSLSETGRGGQPRRRASASTGSDGGSADGVEEPRVSPSPATHMLRVGSGKSAASVVVGAAGGWCETVDDSMAMTETEKQVAREIKITGRNGCGAALDAPLEAAGSEEAVRCSSDAPPGVTVSLNVASVEAQGACAEMPPASSAESEGIRSDRRGSMHHKGAGLSRTIGWAPASIKNRGGDGGNNSSRSSGNGNGNGSGSGSGSGSDGGGGGGGGGGGSIGGSDLVEILSVNKFKG